MEREIPANFFDAEERCGYLVTSRMKRIWGVQLELLRELLRVCKKHDIKAAVSCGTLLGAIRHRGYIPWDDDIDVSLTRENYEKLLSYASEFKEPYFLQTALSDRRYMLGYARLRHSNTTGLIVGNESPDYHNGIYIDVFVLDGYIASALKYKLQRKIMGKLWKNARRYYEPTEGLKWTRKLVTYLTRRTLCRLVSYETMVGLYQKTLAMYSGGETEFFTLLTHSKEEQWINRCTKAEMDDLIEVPFEYLEVPVPRNYDAILKRIYGDYMAFPPPEKRGNWHEGILIFDPDVPYKEYMQQYREKSER